jgi:HEAT repeat protein
MMVEALGKMKDPRAVDILLPLLKDEDVYGHTIIALGETRAQRARRRIEPFVNHSYGWIQSAAKRALRKIDKEREGEATRKQNKLKRGSR